MSKVIVEPHPVGVAGKLIIDQNGTYFEWDGKRIALLDGFPESELKGLRSKSVLLGTLQCYRGWTVQPKDLVLKWLENQESSNSGKEKPQEVRVLFRVLDFGMLGPNSSASMNYAERKALMDQILPDLKSLQKNPYLVLSEKQACSFIDEQPSSFLWKVRYADKEDLEDKEVVGNVQKRQKDFSGLGVDLCLSGGWLDLSEIEKRMNEMKVELESKEEELHQVLGRLDELNQKDQSEHYLRIAGQRYLADLKAKGERYLLALCAPSEPGERLTSYQALFESPDINVERLERYVSRLGKELELLYPTEPISRSSVLDFAKSDQNLRWEQYKFDSRRGHTPRRRGAGKILSKK